MVKELKNYINGSWIKSETNHVEDVINPAKDEVIGRVPFSTKEEVKSAIGAAKESFESEWRNASINERVDPLYKYVEVLERNQEELATTLIKEHGKEWDAAVGEMRRAIQMVQSACAAIETQKGDFSENIATAIDEYSVMRPLGVFTMIPPFNFPAMVPWWFIPFALAVGDTYILKPNEQCPMTQQHMFELIDQELDLPDGVINLVNGGPEVANLLIEHPDIEGVSSVSSTKVAKTIYQKAAGLGKRAQCQAGANNFHVVLADANLDKAIDNLLGPYWGNTGQRCLAGSILLVDKEIYQEFKERFIEATKQLTIGYGLEKDIDIGPVVSKKALHMLEDYIETGLKEGAELVLDGRNVQVEGYPDGYFLGPTIFENAKPGMRIFDEEVFGPVACLAEISHLDEAIHLIKGNRYGNAITIYTESGYSARKLRNEVEVGNVGVNIGTVAPMAYYPFSGMKDSFFGDLHGQSKDVINFFTERQVVIERWLGE